MAHETEFSQMGKTWAKNLEISRPEGVEEGKYTEFNNRNQHHFKEIEDFIHIVNDWIDHSLTE